MNDWIEWDATAGMPIPQFLRVDVNLQNGRTIYNRETKELIWTATGVGGDIVAYRPVLPDLESLADQLRAAGYTVTAPRTFADIEPMRAAPGTGTTYHMPVLDAAVLVLDDTWAGAHVDQTRFRRGLCYATRADAEIAARAMIEMKGGVV